MNRNPVTKEDRSVLEVFHQFGKWLDRWKASGNIGLSTQTFKAAILTTQMLIDLCNYLQLPVLVIRLLIIWKVGLGGTSNHQVQTTIFQYSRYYKVKKV